MKTGKKFICDWNAVDWNLVYAWTGVILIFKQSREGNSDQVVVMPIRNTL